MVDARRMSDQDLKDFIAAQCESRLVALIPSKLSPGGWIKAKEVVIESIGSPIPTKSALKKESRKDNTGSPRSVIMRALMGGLTKSIHTELHNGAPIAVAKRVFTHFEHTWDPAIILNWVGNAGRFKRKRALQPQQPPAAAKRGRRHARVLHQAR